MKTRTIWLIATGIFFITLSCSTGSQSPEDVAVEYYASCFDGDYDKAMDYIISLSDEDKQKFKLGTIEYFEDFKKNHGKIKEIVVEGSEMKSETEFYVRLNIRFEDGYAEDENLTLKKIDGKWGF